MTATPDTSAGAGPSIPPPKAPRAAPAVRAHHLGQLITVAMAGGMGTLIVERFLGIVRGGVLASLMGLLLVATLLTVVFINIMPTGWWKWVPGMPMIPSRLLPFVFLGGMIAGFIFGWLYW
jgi:hypothetical protein